MLLKDAFASATLPKATLAFFNTRLKPPIPITEANNAIGKFAMGEIATGELASLDSANIALCGSFILDSTLIWLVESRLDSVLTFCIA